MKKPPGLRNIKGPYLRLHTIHALCFWYGNIQGAPIKNTFRPNFLELFLIGAPALYLKKWPILKIDLFQKLAYLKNDLFQKLAYLKKMTVPRNGVPFEGSNRSNLPRFGPRFFPEFLLCGQKLDYAR